MTKPIVLDGKKIIPIDDLLLAMTDGRVVVDVAIPDIGKEHQMVGRMGPAHVISALVDQIKARDMEIEDLNAELMDMTRLGG